MGKSIKGTRTEKNYADMRQRVEHLTTDDSIIGSSNFG